MGDGSLRPYGAANVGRFINRSIEAKRKACIKRYGSEWGKEAEIKAKKQKNERKKETEDNNSSE